MLTSLGYVLQKMLQRNPTRHLKMFREVLPLELIDKVEKGLVQMAWFFFFLFQLPR